VGTPGGDDPDTGDIYRGLDRFGRVKDLHWLLTGSGTTTDRFAYGHDRNGNRLYRDNLVNTAFGELYHAGGASGGYDRLDQLKAFRRGPLDNEKDDINGAGSRQQDWCLDSTGNWDRLTTDGVDQFRSQDRRNRITSISGQTTPAYNRNGNMTVDESGNTLVYDAWNRLVEVDNGQTVLASYAVDALDRRISEDTGTSRALYYSANWQVVEERESGVAVVQNVWSPVYIDALTLRDRDSDANSGNGLEERLYVQQDANFNVTALVDAAGSVVERFVYDPYGLPTVLTPAWGSRSGSSYAWVYMHQGGRFEQFSGLYNFRNRDSSTAFGRWVQLDPLGFAAGDRNLYRFEMGGPLNHLDPKGLDIHIFYFEGARPGAFIVPRKWAPIANLHKALIIPLMGQFTAKKGYHWYPFEGTAMRIGVLNALVSVRKIRGIFAPTGKVKCWDRLVVIGYSWGGNSAIAFTRRLASPIVGQALNEIELVVTIDPVPWTDIVPGKPLNKVTRFTAADLGGARIAKKWLNYYQTTDTKTLLGGIQGQPLVDANKHIENIRMDKKLPQGEYQAHGHTAILIANNGEIRNEIANRLSKMNRWR
jgi:RHS repeat-associated protein